MKPRYNIYLAKRLSLLTITMFLFGCENKNVENLEKAKYPTTPEVFIDDFSLRMQYSAFKNSVYSAFAIDNSITYNKSNASMRFDVPNVKDTDGTFAGGSFYTSMPRDLTGYDALTFWAKASQYASIDVIGFGNDFDKNTYQASISNTILGTTWKKYIIPLPDSSLLTAEKGLFIVSDGPEDGKGYSFWIDEVKFEKLGTLSLNDAAILSGKDKQEQAFIGSQTTIDTLYSVHNLPNNQKQKVLLTPGYFKFISSNPAVATVDALGKVSILSVGTSVITASMNGEKAKGSLTILPSSYEHAPQPPTMNVRNVISIFTDKYSNVSGVSYLSNWPPYQTTTGPNSNTNSTSLPVTVFGDKILHYQNMNFVGIELNSTVNISTMTNFHMDIFVKDFDTVNGLKSFKVKFVDFGANNKYDNGGDDTTIENIIIRTNATTPALAGQQWISFDVSVNLPNVAHLAQIVLESTNFKEIYVDNIYFYKN